MKNSKYWQKRFEQIEDSSNRIASQVAKETEKMFQDAEKEIEKEISVWYQRFATNNGIKIQDAKKLLKSDELKELKWSIEEYIKYGHENELNEQWMKELENASAKYHISRLEALKLQTRQTIEALYNNEENVVSTMVERVYSDGYYHSIFEIQKGFGIGWDIGAIDQNKLKTIISKPWATDGKNFSDRIWQSKGQLINDLYNELTRSCILGKSPDQAIKNISKKFNTSKSQAGRLIMTEQAYFSSVAQKDVFKELDVDKYEIVATLDNRTSIICQDMDGHVFDMKDYAPGVTAPPFHPNCRTTTVPYFNDEYSIGERAAKDENGNTYYVPSNLKYNDWKEQFINGNTKSVKKVVEEVAEELIKNNDLESLDKKIDSLPEPIKMEDYDYKTLAYQLKEDGYLTDDILKTRSFMYDGEDEATKMLLKSKNYNDLPVLLDEEAFDNLSDDYIKVFRGVNDNKDLTAAMINEQFRTGELYIGNGLFGNGTYTAINKEVAEHFGTDILEIAIPKKARIVNYKDIEKELMSTVDKPREWKPINIKIGEFVDTGVKYTGFDYDYSEALFTAQENRHLRSLLNDTTFKAVACNYDVIEVDGEDWYRVLTEEARQEIDKTGINKKPYYVILNRGISIVKRGGKNVK